MTTPTPQEYWNAQKATFSTRKTAQANNYTQGKSNLAASVPAALRATDSTSDPLQTWSLTNVDQVNKDKVLNAVSELQTLNGDIATVLSGAQLNTDTITANIASLQTEIDTLKRNRAGEKTVMELRKEQAAALETKYASNLHTSWLGLWRPLSDQGQFGLGFFAFLFGAIAVGVLGYLAYTLYGGRLVGGGGSTPSTGAVAAGANYGFGPFE